MKYLKPLIFIVCTSMCISANAVDYGKLMTDKVKATLGKNAVKGYVFSTYPLDNFGIATAYENKRGPENFICATWECVGIDDHAIRDFIEWYCSDPRLAFNKTVVTRYRIALSSGDTLLQRSISDSLRFAGSHMRLRTVDC
jgi:hypothetical protein